MTETTPLIDVLGGRGGRLLFVRRPELRVSIVSAWFPAGSCFDPVGKEGLAHFFEHLMLQKSKRDASRIERLEKLEAAGIDMYAYTQKEVAYFYHIQTPERTASSLEFLVEGITAFDYSDEDVIRERDVILSERSAYEANPNERVWDAVFEGLFSGSPFAHNPFGTNESLAAIVPDDITAFARDRYRLSDAVWVVLAPDGEEGFFQSELERLLSPLVTDSNKDLEKAESSLPIGSVIPRLEGTGELLSFAYRTSDAGNQRQLAAIDLLRSILASGWISLLNKKLRTETGLIYWANGAGTQFSDRGYVAFFLEGQEKNMAEIEKLALAEIERTKDLSFLEGNLAMHQSAFATKFLRVYHNPEDLLWWYGNGATSGKFSGNPEQYLDLVRSLTPADIAQAASGLFTMDRRTIARV